MKYACFILLLVAVMVVLNAHAESPELVTRRVINGDLVYQAQAFAADEVRSVFLAEARVAKMFAIECGAPPRETRVYSQRTQRMNDGAYWSQIQAGAPIADCEKVRGASGAERLRLGHSELLKSLSIYDKIIAGDRAPAIVPTQFIFSAEQEAGFLKNLEKKTNSRLQERERVAFKR